MLRINLSTLRNKIDGYVKEYYAMKEKPVLKEIPTELRWIRDMVSTHVEYAIINLELKDMAHVHVSEKMVNYNNDNAMKSCVQKKGYTIKERLGNNYYSNKFLVDGNKVIKVKYLSLWDYKQKDELKSMIHNEFKICKKAEILGIAPKIYDTFICYNTSEGTAFKVIVSEYVSGQSLDKWLQENKDGAKRLRVFKLVKAKLEKMHENGIIHNDLHSNNVIVKADKNGKVRDVLITDFVYAYDVQDKSMWDYNKWIRDDRSLLSNIRNGATSYNNADDVAIFVVNRLLEKKNIIIS